MKKTMILLLLLAGCTAVNPVRWNPNAGKAGEGRCQQVNPPYHFVADSECGK
jgi:hypothetical protein